MLQSADVSGREPARYGHFGPAVTPSEPVSGSSFFLNGKVFRFELRGDRLDEQHFRRGPRLPEVSQRDQAGASGRHGETAHFLGGCMVPAVLTRSVSLVHLSCQDGISSSKSTRAGSRRLTPPHRQTSISRREDPAFGK